MEIQGLFDNDSKYGKAYRFTHLTDQAVSRAEGVINHTLSPSYLEFLRLQNGGLIDWRKHDTWLTAIYGIAPSSNMPNSLEVSYRNWIYGWEYPESCVPFGETQSGGHDLYCFGYATLMKNGEPRIVRIDNERNNAAYLVADTFTEFIQMVMDGKDIQGHQVNMV